MRNVNINFLTQGPWAGSCRRQCHAGPSGTPRLLKCCLQSPPSWLVLLNSSSPLSSHLCKQKHNYNFRFFQSYVKRMRHWKATRTFRTPDKFPNAIILKISMCHLARSLLRSLLCPQFVAEQWWIKRTDME